MSLFELQAGDVRRSNNFGSLRLLFASLVILAHSPEMTDGNRSREILSRVFGTLSFGELAVDGFFIVSGYLITKSFKDSKSIGSYLGKRILRIYPGFIVAFLVSALLVAPIAGGDFTQVSAVKDAIKLVFLGLPRVPGAFADLPQPALNGSLWTIAYEFRCYLLVIGFGWLTARMGRFASATVLVAIATIYAFRNSLPDVSDNVAVLTGGLNILARLAFVFFVGSAYYILRKSITYTNLRALFVAFALVALMFVPSLAEPAFAILGGYLIFWFAFACKANPISRIMDHTDPSYGIYLYAWPIQNLLIFFVAGISPWVVAAITLPVATILGLLSWYLVEKPALRYKGFLDSVWDAAMGRIRGKGRLVS